MPTQERLEVLFLLVPEVFHMIRILHLLVPFANVVAVPEVIGIASRAIGGAAIGRLSGSEALSAAMEISMPE